VWNVDCVGRHTIMQLEELEETELDAVKEDVKSFGLSQVCDN